MICSFRCKDTQGLFEDIPSRRFRALQRVARCKLETLGAATLLADLKVPPGNRLEALKGEGRGQHGVRINDQWRLCFRWKDGNAFDVEIVDYH